MEEHSHPRLIHWLFGSAILCDLIGALTESDPFFFQASFWLIAAGILTSLVTAFLHRETQGLRAPPFGWYKAANLTAVLLFALSLALRLPILTAPSNASLYVAFVAAGLVIFGSWSRGELRVWLGAAPLSAIVAASLLLLAIGLYLGQTSTLLHRPLRDDSLRTLRGHRGGVLSVALSPDNRFIASGGWDETVRLWDAHTGQMLHVLRGHTDRVMAVAFSPDGSMLVSGSKDGTARVWDAMNGRSIHVLSGHADRVTSLAFSPNGFLLATGSRDQTIKLWEVHSWHELRTLVGHEGFIWSLSFDPTGRQLVSGSWDGTARVWDVVGRGAPTVLDQQWHVSVVAFSPDGRFLAVSGDHEGNICEAGYHIYSRFGDSSIFAIRGELAYCADADRAIRIRSLKGDVESTLSGHADTVTSAVVSADGHIIVSESEDGTVKTWRADTMSQLRLLDSSLY